MKEQNYSPKLTFFSFDFPPNEGGIARMTYEIAGELANTVEDVDVLTQSSVLAFDDSEFSNLRINRLDKKNKFHQWYGAFNWLRQSSSRIIFCSRWYPEGLIAVLAKKKPIIMTHGAELLNAPQAPLLKRILIPRLIKWVLEKSMFVVANSHFTGQLATDLSEKIKQFVIPLAVNPSRFSVHDKEDAKKQMGVENKFVITTISRLQSHKGHDIVLRAIAGLSTEQKRGIIYQIGGKGPQWTKIKELAIQLGIDSNLRYLGFIPDENLSIVYSATDLFALCSKSLLQERKIEGFGLVFLEAQACGTAVVGAKSGGIPDAIEHDNGGWLIEESDYESLRKLIFHLLSNSSELQAAGFAARRRIEKSCTWEIYTKKLLQLVQQQSINR